MPSSHEWRAYYEENARTLLEIPWHLGAELTPPETAAIARSVQEFQAGESSEGTSLYRYAQAYAERTGDRQYVAAVRLFIAEEQRHARDLGRFLTLNGIPLVRTTFTDRVFRRLRHLFGGLEMSIAVLITAEIIAKVYYAVLREATRSATLRRLCDQILHDEIRHVQFQAEQLARLRAGRRGPRMAATVGLQRFLFLGTTVVVWLFHRTAIRQGGQSLGGWWRSCWQEFNEAFAHPGPAPDLQLTTAVPVSPALTTVEGESAILHKANVVGQYLDAIVQTYALGDGWLDHVDSIFVLRSGAAFRLPGFAGDQFESMPIPQDARPVRHPTVDNVLGRRIAAVYRPRADEDFVPDSVYLQMETGHWIWQASTAPHGTGTAGIHVRASGPLDERADLIDFWS